VFERVARSVVAGALEGFNGTIFAYGQTGSGKTFTMTGGPERYVDRGIIPRGISAIFADIAKRSDSQVSVKISYLEIYNETGYDLLDPDREVMALEDMPKVSSSYPKLSSRWRNEF
jgi:kinesin family protein 6/9